MKVYFIIVAVLLSACHSESQKENDNKFDFCTRIHRNDTISLSKELESVTSLMKDKTGVYVLEDGGNSLVARAWFSEYAERSIDIQYFIFSTDNVGLIACDYLVRAADRGVKVRLLVDDMLIDAKLEEVLMLDSHPNIEIKIYNTGVNLGKNIVGKLAKFATDFHSANQRMHNKTFLVDGKIVITGGRNIADEYFDYDHEYNFRDRDVLLIGKAARDVQRSFNEFWNHALSKPVAELGSLPENVSTNPKRFEPLHQYACDSLNFWPQVRDRITNFPVAVHDILHSDKMVWTDSVTFVSDIPGKNDGKNGLKGGGLTTDVLIKLVEKAQKSIEIQTPYLITTDLAQGLFRNAAKRGVKIRILTNSLASTDNLEAFSGYQRDREKLLKTGIRIFEFRPDAKVRFEIMTGALQKKMNFTPIFGLHAKSMVIDGKTTVIGTFNLDPRSANLNTECVTIIHSEKVTKGVLKEMEIEFKPDNAWETTLKSNPDSVAGRMKRMKTWTRKVVPKSIL
jgi:putative cardiolipin synthase